MYLFSIDILHVSKVSEIHVYPNLYPLDAMSENQRGDWTALAYSSSLLQQIPKERPEQLEC